MNNINKVNKFVRSLKSILYEPTENYTRITKPMNHSKARNKT